MTTAYKNRYGDIFTFELQEDGNILWSGEFKYCRFGMPNDYTRAYEEYCKDYSHSQSLMPLTQFKSAVHEYDDETHQYFYDKYVRMVDSLKDKISMIDPSGGPYISTGMDMGSFDEAFKGMTVDDFKVHKNGYLIIIKK
jgi:hypothetical protein